MFRSKPHLCAFGIAALLALAACGGGGDPVVGTAEPVPEITPTPSPTPMPTPPPTQPLRFTQVAPEVEAAPLYQSSPAIQYNLGLLPVRSDLSANEQEWTGQSSYIFLSPIRGWIRFPQEALQAAKAKARFPIVVMLHGNHSADDPSYRGYDYLARNLAQHGYVAISIDANAINGFEYAWMTPDGKPIPDEYSRGDASSVSRGQLVLGTLDRLKQIDESGGPGLLSMLQGKLDFERVGLMGHSRGGQGLSNAVKFNVQRDSVTERALKAQLKRTPSLFDTYPDLKAALNSSGVLDEKLFGQAVKALNIVYSPEANTVRPYQFRAGMWLAPTNFEGTVGLSNIPLAVLLPSCDGDLRDLQGARTFDSNRYGFDYDGASRMQVLVRGANHNFYNTIWTGDDAERGPNHAQYGPFGVPDPYCDASRDHSPRLTPEDQRRGGLFLVNSFMRYFVGSEAAFQPYWSSHGQLPAAACPQGEWPCDARVALTVQQNASKRLSIHRFADAGSLGRNSLGGAMALSGFDANAWCDMAYGSTEALGMCLPGRLTGFENNGVAPGGFRSIAEHMELAWSAPFSNWTSSLNGVSAKGFDTLSFRIAVVRPFGQEVEVTLIDTAGQSAMVKASHYSDALYQGPQLPGSGSPLTMDAGDVPFSNGQTNQILNMVAIPLGAFQGVDMSSLKELRMNLPAPSGKVALADVQFQQMDR